MLNAVRWLPMNPKTPLAAATIFVAGCLVRQDKQGMSSWLQLLYVSCLLQHMPNATYFTSISCFQLHVAFQVNSVHAEVSNVCTHGQAIAICVADASRSLRANDKPVTEEQHRALLEQVQAAQDPSAFPTSLCASSPTRYQGT